MGTLAHPLVRDGQLQKFWASMLETGSLVGGSVATTLDRPIRVPNFILIERQDSEREAVKRRVARCGFRVLCPWQVSSEVVSGRGKHLSDSRLLQSPKLPKF